ncbi:MAG: translational GTPase TypA [Planctomycetes bacterium]|nr:translational GTPase TypA [Planctomycetota bacterium]
MTTSERSDIRNIAIIAHVDHGKTTLVDQLLKQSGTFRANQPIGERIMDSNEIERERGITILAKNTSVVYQGIRINIIDTPGHADFGGEVERVLKMADGVLLVVDAAEGPMPQTTFVLKKALAYQLPAIVVINKIDRPVARPHEALDKVFDLFVDLDAEEKLLDFPVVYTNAIEGVAKHRLEQPSANIQPLFEEILRSIPCPKGDPSAPLQMLVSSLDYNSYVGRFGIGRIFQGTLRAGETVAVVTQDGRARPAKVLGLYGFHGLERKPIEEARMGDIVAVSGIEELSITETLTHREYPIPIPTLPLDEPTVQMIFTVNDGPFAGEEGQFVTSRQLRERLYRELFTNLALRVQDGATRDEFLVSGRGLLHLGILLENMRREGYELMVGKPVVIDKEIDGEVCEPFETAVVDAPKEILGTVIQLMGVRGGETTRVENVGNRVQATFIVPSRGLIGLRSKLLTASRGEAILHHNFLRYAPRKGEVQHRTQGVLVSADAGEATFYALDQLRRRGQFFLRPGERVYEGVIVGEHCEENDLVVRATRTKRLTNVRAASAEKLVVLPEPREMTLEAALEYVEDDEWVEVTPRSVRLRKKTLSEKLRRRQENVQALVEP